MTTTIRTTTRAGDPAGDPAGDRAGEAPGDAGGAAIPALAGDPELAADARRVHDALTSLVRVYQFRDRDWLCRADLTVSQCYALEVVATGEGRTVNEVAGTLFLDKSTASRTVGALVEKGYVRRRPHPDDGRAVLLEATPEGRETYRGIEADVIREEARLLADFEPDARKAAAELLGRLARAARERVDTTGGCCSWVGGPAGSEGTGDEDE